MGGNYEKSIYNQLMEVMERLESVESSSRKEIYILHDRIDTLEKENESLKKENQLLKDDNERLKSILNNDSSNTSLPPSTDQKGKAANRYNSREKSGRKKGGQPGHKGAALTKADVEARLLSGRYAHKIEDIGKKQRPYVVKYVMDIEIVPVIREIRIHADEDGRFTIPGHLRSDVTYGPSLKATAVELYGEGAMSNERICTFLNTLSGNALGLSAGSVYGFCRDFAEKAAASIAQAEEELLNEKTVCTDATVVTVNGKQAYIRNFSSAKAVLYTAMEKKDMSALDAVPFLSAYAGTLEHDHETALYHYGTGHGECNVHLMRYLRKNTEEAASRWSVEMSDFLGSINAHRKQLEKAGKNFTEEEIRAYESRYDEILSEGRIQNQATKGRYAKADEKKLLNRLEKYKANHLLFLHDFSVPFENNMSERDLRKCKNRQKIAGGFRKQSGNEMYCCIMSIIETCKRKEMQVMENIKKIFEGTPAIF